MILNPKQYADTFPQNGKVVHQRTIKRRCATGNLPSNHNVYNVNGRWLIDIHTEYCGNCQRYHASSILEDEGRCQWDIPSRGVRSDMWCNQHKFNQTKQYELERNRTEVSKEL